ncbi:RHS repeat protein [Candidatus Marithioploca araucensis]|uniref:RHS repeat protein n=1 Tax=Candidatus Marithioploca araucensis TaxID=70273 RepID=A0ABT7VSH5_9GAMM|nr:RHS repeat protein [Candidatus Marithioploca araucensis]
MKVTDWANRVTVYDYDKNGRLISTLRHNGTKMTRVYDEAGQLKQQKEIVVATSEASVGWVNCRVGRATAKPTFFYTKWCVPLPTLRSLRRRILNMMPMAISKPSLMPPTIRRN